MELKLPMPKFGRGEDGYWGPAHQCCAHGLGCVNMKKQFLTSPDTTTVDYGSSGSG
jgi:hypothetical protein